MKNAFLLIGLLSLVCAFFVGDRSQVRAASNKYCSNVQANAQGTSNQDITIDNTAGGIVVLAQSPTRCSAVIFNVSNPIRCAASTGAGAMTVTATAGFLLNAGTGLALSIEDGVSEGWKCIRTTASSSTVSVIEGRSQ